MKNKKIHYIYSLILSFCFLSLNLIAQPENSLVGDVVLPNPTASSLGKYTDVPISYFSGTPNIGIPIGTVVDGKLSTNINISYHASGIKVNELASWVGIGWALNAGGVITRTTLGIPDELNETYRKGWLQTGPTVSSLNGVQGYEANLGRFDIEPDIFSFNFDGYSGKFYFDKNGNPVLTQSEDIKVELVITSSPNKIESFTLTNPNGTKYHFGKYENRSAYDYQWSTTTAEPNLILGEKYISNWHLVAIESHDDKDRIDFYYQNERYQYEQPPSCSYSSSILISNNCGMSESTEIGCSTGDPSINIINYVEGERLVNIKSTTQNVQFNANTEREDLDLFSFDGFGGSGANRLDEIKISTGTFSKYFDFRYSYFIDNTQTEDKSHLKRLRLDQVQERSSNGDLIPPYSFDYQGSFLPNRFSKAIDHWGFYNGKENPNNYLTVLAPPTTIEALNGANFTYGEANRDANPATVNVGMLEKITYPTGGHTQFDYECNEAYNEEGIFKELIFFKDCGDDIGQFFGVGNDLEDNIICINENSSGTFSFSSEEELEKSRMVLDLYSYHPSNDPPPPGGSLNPYVLYFTVTFTNPITNQPDFITQAVLQIDYPWQSKHLDPSIVIDFDDYPNLQSNIDYNVTTEVTASNTAVNSNNGVGRISIQTLVPVNELIGGVRIASTIQHDGNTANDIIKTYEYTSEEDPLKSSGKIRVKPVYGSYYESIVEETDTSGGGTLILKYFHANTIVPLGGYDGRHIGYSRVIEHHNELGSIEYNYFLDNTILPQGILNPPLAPPAHHSNMQSSETKNNNEDIVAFSNNAYEPLPTLQSNPSTEVFNPYKQKSYTFFGCSNPTTFRVTKPYSLESSRIRVLQTISSLDGVSTVTKYEYNQDLKHNFPTATSVTNSDGKVHRTETKYAHETTQSNQVDLLNKHMIGIPLEQRKYVDGVLQGGHRIRYINFATGTYPKYFYEILNDNSERLKHTIINYNSNGLPTGSTSLGFPEVSYTYETNDLVETKIWDNNFTTTYKYYDNTRLLKTVTNSDGTSSLFKYDDLLRFEKSIVYGVSSGGNSSLKSETTTDYQIGGGNNMITSTTTFDDAPTQTSNQSFDGLGRPTSSSVNGISTESYTYDNYGRIAQQQYLPGSYTTLEYEESPLNRSIKSTFPDGSDVETVYGSSGNYYLVESIDENDNPSKVITDILGRTAKTIDALDNITEFVYDDRGNISSVSPPNSAETQEIYDYTYDQYNRLTTKIIPSGGTHEFRYNDKDQLVASQTGNEWIGTIYDSYGRPDETGTIAGTAPDGNISIAKIYTKTYYDDYGELDADMEFAPYLSSGGNTTTVKGKVVGTKVRVLGTDDFIYTTTAYDEFGRSFKTNSSNLLEGNDSITIDLNLADLPTKITRSHNTSLLDEPQDIIEDFTYDNFLRTYTHHHDIDGADRVLLSRSNYNGIGQLTSKKIGQADGINGFIQNIDYKYNTRGWLTHINDINMIGANTSICGDPPPPCGEKCDFSVEFSFEGDDAIIDIIYGVLDPATNTYNPMSAALNYPYTPTYNNDFTHLENDLIAWMFSENIPNDGVTITYADGIYKLSIFQTDAKFQIFKTFANGSKPFANSCSPRELEICDYTVSLEIKGRDAITQILVYDRPADLNYPYDLNLTGVSQLEIDLLNWLQLENIANNGVFINLQNTTTITIYQTDANFQSVTTNYLGGVPFVKENCGGNATPSTCDYSVYVPASINDHVTNITYDNLTIPLNYPYNSAPSTGLSALVADLTAWLNAENIPHQGVSIFNSGDVLTLSIYQTNIEFQTITTNAIGVRAFNQVNCSTQSTPTDDDICIRCIDEGYECDRCPYTQSPDKCTQCFDAGYDDCEQCPFMVKLIRPTSIKVEYNHPALTSSDLLSNATLVRVTERSYRTLYNDQVLPTHKTLNTVVGDGIISSAPLTHVMEINLGDQWVNEVTLDAVKGNIHTLLINQLANAGINSTEMQTAFATAVVEIAANDWGGTSAKLDDDGGGQIPTSGPPNIQNPDMFSLQLTYADGHAMVNSPIQRNGNISGMIWQTPGRNTQSYSLEYDEINRLKDAYHQDVISGGQLSTDNKYGVEITYDKVGNINTLNRRGVIDICPTPTPTFEYGPMDALSYNYIKDDGSKTNRLQSIEEFANIDHGFKSEGGKYEYDGFGNMTTDAKTGASIDYNHLNLPKRITVSGEGSIEFTYDAAGIKLKKEVSGSDGYIINYIGGIEYRDDKMESIQHAEGRITFHEETDTEEVKPLYEYFLKDHLGNVRVTLADKDGDGYIEPFNVNPGEPNSGGTGDDLPVDLTNTDVLQETHYYPFGMTMEGEWQNIVNGPENKYLYNGKELNSDFGLDWHDYGARYYDPAIARWGQVDPMAEERNSLSPYNYVQNNPLLRIDPTGALDDIYLDKDGNYLGSDGAETNNVRVIDASAWGDDSEAGDAMRQSEEGTEMLQSNSDLLTEYEDGIAISEGTWEKVEKAGGKEILATVENASGGQVVVLPESHTKPLVTLENGESYYPEADGLKDTSHKSDQVYKIGRGGKVIVTSSRCCNVATTKYTRGHSIYNPGEKGPEYLQSIRDNPEYNINHVNNWKRLYDAKPQ